MSMPELCLPISSHVGVINWVALYLFIGVSTGATSQSWVHKLEVAVWPLKWAVFAVFFVYHLPRVFRQVRRSK